MSQETEDAMTGDGGPEVIIIALKKGPRPMAATLSLKPPLLRKGPEMN
jgi:hypothetical protein